MLVIELGREDVAADLAVELPVVALPLPDEVPLPGLITLCTDTPVLFIHLFAGRRVAFDENVMSAHYYVSNHRRTCEISHCTKHSLIHRPSRPGLMHSDHFGLQDPRLKPAEQAIDSNRVYHFQFH